MRVVNNLVNERQEGHASREHGPVPSVGAIAEKEWIESPLVLSQ